jgi:hypothetical protein
MDFQPTHLALILFANRALTASLVLTCVPEYDHSDGLRGSTAYNSGGAMSPGAKSVRFAVLHVIAPSPCPFGLKYMSLIDPASSSVANTGALLSSTLPDNNSGPLVELTETEYTPLAPPRKISESLPHIAPDLDANLEDDKV